MLRTMFKSFFVCLTVWALGAWGQSIHLIMVGDTGSFYDPGDVVAAVGDVINFQWTGVFHSVTQSSFDDPCTPLPGGFDSQFQGNTAGAPLVIPQWNLTITNASQPIWFFCKSTMPVSHCTAGMVGVINAPITGVNQSYDAFVAKAKALTSIPPVVVGSPILTGVGAFATSPPASSRPSQTNSSVSQSTTSTSSTSTTTTSTPSAISKTSSGLSAGAKGGIIGGVVGGILIIIALIVLLIMMWRRGRRYKKNVVEQKLYYPPTREIFHEPSNPSMSIGRRRSLGSTADSLDREGSGTGSQTLNVKELAAEIARNIRQEHVIHEISSASSRSQYATEMSSPSLRPVAEHNYGTIPNPDYSNEFSQFSQPPTPDSATTLLSQQQRQPRSHSSPSRQLPIPPPPPSSMSRGPRRTMDAMSVDTLPAYATSPH